MTRSISSPGKQETLIVRFLYVLLAVLSTSTLISCDSEPVEARNVTAQTGEGFQARISGAYEGSIASKGVLAFIPQGGFDRQGYFILADGQGLRPHGVTFTLPRGTREGRYSLESPSPLDIGTVVSARVDRDLGASLASYEVNTRGYVDLTVFPDSERIGEGALASGDFDFQAENADGESIRVTGSFAITP